MSELKQRYEKAKQKFERERDSMQRNPLVGDAGKGQQSRYIQAYKHMERLRNELIEQGEWEGPRPIKLRAKYR